MQRLLPPVLLILTWVAMILATVFWPIGGSFPFALRVVGAAGAVIGIVIAVKGARVFKSVGTDIMTFGTPSTLVTTGLFAWSRNPMYLGLAFCALGGGILLGTVSALVIALIFCLILDRWYVAYEETVMIETFGADYARYRAQVRRWL